MAYEMKELAGSLFKNDQKEDETHADFNGSAKIGGVEYWVNAWVKSYEKDGTKRKYFSLSFRPKQKPSEVKAPAKPVGKLDEMDDDIPW